MASIFYYDNTNAEFKNILDKIRKTTEIDNFINKIKLKSFFIWKIVNPNNRIPGGEKQIIAYDFFGMNICNIDITKKSKRDEYKNDNTFEKKVYVDKNTQDIEIEPNLDKKNGLHHINLNNTKGKKSLLFNTTLFAIGHYMIGLNFEKDPNNIEYAFFAINPDENPEIYNFYNSLKSNNNTQSRQNKDEHDENSPVNSNADPNTDPASTPHLPDYFKPENIIFYGVPGCGKSYHIKNIYIENETSIKDFDKQTERVVFHPDYTYADFVGQILPQTDGTKLEYKFIPGPFTRILKEAYKNPSNEYCLIIEEINRGNAAAIFGDLFQLLDRDDKGYSEYNITNKDIADEITEKYKDIDENTKKINLANINIDLKKDLDNVKIKIPNNLTLLATMNTSDQNVFTLDTAFQRRWRMKSIPNDFDEATDMKNLYIPGTDITWIEFGKWINEKILDKNAEGLTSEDKRLGTHFVKKSDLQATPDKGTKEEIEAFAEKVYKYLWDDAFKMDRSIFKIGKGEKDIKSLENIINICSKNYKLNEIFDISEAELKKLIDKSISTSSADLTLGSTTGSSDDSGDAHKESVTPAAETTEDGADADKTEDITKKEEETPINPIEKTEETIEE